VARTAVLDGKWYHANLADVKQSVADYKRNDPIFQYRWSADAWTTTFQNTKTNLGRHQNRTRHQLQVVVMLNTLGSVRRGWYFFGPDAVRVNLPRTHADMKTTVYTHDSKIQLMERKFPRTHVSVENIDCIIATQRLLSTHNPVMLNMANKDSPGGGYRKGDGAQEENVFRRSNYYLSLDDLDYEAGGQNRGEKPAKARKPGYPIDSYAGIHTSGITVFRDTQDQGYRYLEAPFKINAIAVCAKRFTQRSERLSSYDALAMRRRIEAIFAIALDQGHDVLVLSALGCGAFKNPPVHVAHIFRTVIDQYNGYFRRIVFAIQDDHNAQGLNFASFSKVLDNYTPSADLKISMKSPLMLGYGSSICDKGGSPHEESKCATSWHPPRCPCDVENSRLDPGHLAEHRFLFRHRVACRDGATCALHDNKNHCAAFTHPPECKDAGLCKLLEDRKHLSAYRHPPVCRDGLECKRYLNNEKIHMRKHLHTAKVCRNGTWCPEIFNEQHRSTFAHPTGSKKICPDSPYCASAEPGHASQYAHVCRVGSHCPLASNAQHTVSFFHIKRPDCKFGKACEERDLAYSHPDVDDFPALCRHEQHGVCTSKHDAKHCQQFLHKGQALFPCKSDQIHAKCDFRKSVTRIIDENKSRLPNNFRIPPEILNYAKGLRPMHRCNEGIFKSILEHKHFVSRVEMDSWKSWVNASREILATSSCPRSIPPASWKKFVESVVEMVYSGSDAKYSGVVATLQNRIVTIKRSWQQLNLNEDFEAKVTMLAKACKQLADTPQGIGYNVDEKLGTNRQVFAIVGPHHGTYYGPVCFLLDPVIMCHPDFNLTPVAGTAFYSGKAHTKRPWGPSDPGNDDQKIAHFNERKFSPIGFKSEEAIALELISTTMQKLNKPAHQVSLRDVQNVRGLLESHFCFEGHMPSRTPTRYVDKVILPRVLYEEFCQQDPQFPRKMCAAFDWHHTELKTRVIQTNASKPFQSTGGFAKGDPQRAEIVQHAMADRPPTGCKSSSRSGMAIGLLSESYPEPVLAPLSLPQRREYFVYFEALLGKGGLFVQLKTPRDRPSPKGLSILLQSSPDAPARAFDKTADLVSPTTRSLCSTNQFHSGCVRIDYIGYCLTVQPTRGTFSLRIVGGNGRYNHQRLEGKFPPGHRDLSTLAFMPAEGAFVTVRRVIVTTSQQTSRECKSIVPPNPLPRPTHGTKTASTGNKKQSTAASGPKTGMHTNATGEEVEQLDCKWGRGSACTNSSLLLVCFLLSRFFSESGTSMYSFLNMLMKHTQKQKQHVNTSLMCL
jgi:uncharacterized protein (TIGR02452 family)